MRKTSHMNTRKPKKFKPTPVKFIVGILITLFTITGCSDMPYTGSSLTEIEVNRYLVSTDGESVCFQDEQDATCIRLTPQTHNGADANNRPAVYIYPERRVYVLYHEGAPIFRAERAQIAPIPTDTQGNASDDTTSTPNGQTGNNNGNNNDGGNNNNGNPPNNNGGGNNNNGGDNNGGGNNNNGGDNNGGGNNNNGGDNNGGGNNTTTATTTVVGITTTAATITVVGITTTATTTVVGITTTATTTVVGITTTAATIMVATITTTHPIITMPITMMDTDGLSGYITQKGHLPTMYRHLVKAA